jgi:glutamine synthetase
MPKKATATVSELSSARAKRGLEERELIEAWLHDNGIRRVRVGGFDIDGLFRGKVISTEKLLSCLDGGFGFCDVIFGWDLGDQLLDNLQVTGWHTGYPDALARIDPATRRVLPWDPGTGMLIVDFYDRQTGAPLPVCPRQTLKRVLERAATRHASKVLAGFEYEFFFFRETPESMRAKGYRGLQTLSPGMFGYSVLRASENAALFNQIFDALGEAGIPLEGMHTETGPGVYECAIRYSDALEAADRAALFKTVVKEIAFRHGVTACFMAKWNAELPGSSGHVHLSLWDEQGKVNRFATTGGAVEFSPAGRQFVGGMLAGCADYLPLVAPTINSYKRLVPNTWAPTTVTWGVENRTTTIRVIPGGTKATRVEFRLPGADSNPYLALAAGVAMGLQGWERGDTVPDVVAANAYAESAAAPLPASLAEATERFAASERVREALGDTFVDHFAATRRWEVQLYRRAVTDWELARYFEAI